MEVAGKQSAFKQVKVVQFADGRKVQVVTLEKTKDKGKKRFSRKGLGDIHELDLAGAKAARRIAKAVDDGLVTWIEQTDKSARKRKDGALRYLLNNQSKALRAYNDHITRVVPDYLDTVADIRGVKKLLRT